MGTTAIISPQIIDSTITGRDLITSVDAAAGRSVLEIEDAAYNWTGDHVFEGSIEATTYNFTAGQDGQLNHPDLGNSLYVRFNNADVYRFNAIDFWPVANGTKNLGRSDHEWANVYSVAGAFSGTVTANAFVGDGSGLTNLPAAGNPFDQDLNTTDAFSGTTITATTGFVGDGSGLTNLPGGNPFDQDLNTTDSPSFVGGNFSGTITNSATTSWSATLSRAIRVGPDSGITWYYGNGNMTKFNTPVTFEASFQFGRPADGLSSRLYRMSKDVSAFKCVAVDGGLNTGTIFQIEDATSTFQPLRTGGNINHYPDNLGAQAYRMYNLGEAGDTDTEYLETSWDTNVATISAKQTGTGVVRDLNFDGHDGTFSGDVSIAANVDFTGLPTADPVVAGRLWNDSGTLKISAG